MNSYEVSIHIHQGCFAGTGAIVRLPQCQWSKPDGYWKISQCITTTKHSKATTVCIFLGIYCMRERYWPRGVKSSSKQTEWLTKPNGLHLRTRIYKVTPHTRCRLMQKTNHGLSSPIVSNVVVCLITLKIIYQAMYQCHLGYKGMQGCQVCSFFGIFFGDRYCDNVNNLLTRLLCSDSNRVMSRFEGYVFSQTV